MVVMAENVSEHDKKLITDSLNACHGEGKDKCLRLLRQSGMMPAYSWIGHRGEYFYPTWMDAEMMQEWRYQCMD